VSVEIEPRELLSRMSTEGAEASDEALAESFKMTRNEAYFDVLYGRHFRRVFWACGRMVSNDSVAEEIAQDVFFKAFRNIDSFHGGKFSSWLYTIARNCCLNYLVLPRVGNEVNVGEDAVGDAVSDLDVEKAFESAEGTGRVRKILALLAPEQRVCLKLFYLEGWPYKEIARRTGYSLRRVKTYVQNGKQRFRRLWEKSEGPSSEGEKSHYEGPEPSAF
jgi:RNA polymerase sigma factor (sigma-70 family)